MIPEFTFESGEKLSDMKVGYATHGQLNPNKTNAIVVTHGASGVRTGNASLIGPGNLIAALEPEDVLVRGGKVKD